MKLSCLPSLSPLSCSHLFLLQPMETKVFTPSSKTIPEKDETVAEQKSVNHNNASQASPQLSFASASKPEETAQPKQPTMSAILSGSIKRTPPATPGQALLQQIQQQQSNAQQNSNLNQYNLSQYSKQATESIKSLVGLSPNIISNDLISSNEHSLDSNLSQVQKQQQQPTVQTNQQNRLKVQNQRSKIPESAVEMPSNDPISNLSVHFGSLEFGTNFSIGGANDSNLFDSVAQNASSKQQQQDTKNLNLLSNDNSANANASYRSANANQQANKSMLQTSVFTQSLNEPNLNSDHRNDKQLNANYSANKQQHMERKNEYMNMSSYKQSYTNDNAYSSAYQSSAPVAPNVGYYSSASQVTPFGNSGPASQSLMAGNAYNATYNNASGNSANTQNVSKIRDMDNSVSQQQVAANSVTASNKPYDAASSVGTSLSLMANSTVTTNVLKNTLSASMFIVIFLFLTTLILTGILISRQRSS